MRLAPVLALLAVAAGCAQGGCPGREVTLRNGSALPVEQAFLGTGAPDGWGADLLQGRANLAPGAAFALPPVGGPAARAVRIVWTNGRAAELGGLEGCRFGQVVVLDAAMRAE